MIESLKKGDKVKVYIDKVLTNGIVTDIEAAKGFRGYPYNIIHVKIDDKTISFRSWDVFPIDNTRKK